MKSTPHRFSFQTPNKQINSKTERVYKFKVNHIRRDKPADVKMNSGMPWSLMTLISLLNLVKDLYAHSQFSKDSLNKSVSKELS